VYLRKTDGSPAVRLGDGMAVALSPDGNWVLATADFEGSGLRLLPTGPGEMVALPWRDYTVRSVCTTWWSKDSGRFAIAAEGSDRKLRVYLASRSTHTLVPVTGELRGSYFAVAADGTIAAVPADSDAIHVFGANGLDLGGVRGAEPGEVPVRYAADGRLVVRKVTKLPVAVYQLDTRTGVRTLWKNLGPTRRDGFDQQEVEWFVVTPDLKYYAYTHGEMLSQLYVAQDLR
jgi:eukaryotic-like serine/threonine-protein kinase